MSTSNRRPILYNGEAYSFPIEKTGGGGTKEYPFTYDQVKEKLIGDIGQTKEFIRSLPAINKLPNEVVVCLRMQPEFSAKSYYPDSLFDSTVTRFGLKEIGSRIWTEQTLINDAVEKKPVQSKLFFMRATESGLNKLEEALSKQEYEVQKGFISDVRKVSSINLLLPSEQILGVSDNWSEGCLEAVIHPFALDKNVAVDHFFNLLENAGVNKKRIKFKQYGEGVTFVSLWGDREVLKALEGYNPLRTVHPLTMRNLPASVSRGTTMLGCPMPPKFSAKSPIVVGVIDGGADENHPYLENYIEIVDSVAGSKDSDCVSHGMQVCGAVLYGALNKYSSSDTLPEPSVSVKSFRVLSDLTVDPDLYDVIDAIEEIVPANKDISVYNLSLGPAGPILDDSVSRFTFACDLLSREHEVLFCVAVGNDGDMEDYDRIQSPADMVNGLSIGAYSDFGGTIERAEYSCVGPGREGNKLKPDLLAFGGCERNPIHLVSPTVGKKIYNLGTSFSSPIVAGFAGRLIGQSNSTIDCLVARALMVHSVRNKNISHSLDMGHGVLKDDFEQIVTCVNNSYTLIYKGEIPEGKYVEYPIPWSEEINNGKVNFLWTSVVLTNVDPQSPDDYTSSSVETIFYPNKNKFMFTKEGKTKTVDVAIEPEEQTRLLSDGWVRANFPKSDSATAQYSTEDELRADLKWDSLDSRSINKLVGHVSNPAFHIHALRRGSRVAQSKVRFALVLTVETTSADIDIYAQVLRNYGALIPLTMNVGVQVPLTV